MDIAVTSIASGGGEIISGGGIDQSTVRKALDRLEKLEAYLVELVPQISTTKDMILLLANEDQKPFERYGSSVFLQIDIFWKIINLVLSKFDKTLESEERIRAVSSSLAVWLALGSEDNLVATVQQEVKLLLAKIEIDLGPLGDSLVENLTTVIVKTIQDINLDLDHVNHLLENQHSTELFKKEFKEILGFDSIMIEGEAEPVPVEVEVFSIYNSDPEAGTGMFDPELIAEFANQFHWAWGLIYREGFLLLPEFWDNETIPLTWLLDPPAENKFTRGRVPLDDKTRRIARDFPEEFAENDEDRLARLQKQGNYIRMWNPITVRRWFEYMYHKPNPRVVVVKVRGEMMGWAISHEDSPEEILSGRCLQKKDGQKVPSVTKIETIGFSYKARRLPQETGRIKDKIGSIDTMKAIAELLATPTQGIAITRMNTNHSALMSFAAGGVTGLRPIMVAGQNELPDVRPLTIREKLKLTTLKDGLLVSAADRERAFFLRSPIDLDVMTPFVNSKQEVFEHQES